MKRTLLVVLIGFVVSGLFAQDKSAAELKNEGNAFLKEKKYADAFKTYEKYLNVLEGDDAATVYNMAICAYKSDDYDNATKYFQKAIDLKYKKGATAYLYKSIVYKKMEDWTNYEKTLKDGVKAYPKGKSSDKMKTSLAKHLAKDGIEKFNKGNKAKADYEYFSKHPDPNELAKADPAKEKATKFFKEALPILEESFSYDSSVKPIVQALAIIYDFMGQADKAEQMNTLLQSM